VPSSGRAPGSVVITGAGGGLGSAACRHLAAAGWRVIAADLGGAGLDALADVRHLTTVAVDVTDPASVSALAEAVASEAPHLQGVVNFAGILEIGSVIEAPASVVERVIDVNVLGTYRVNQALFPALLAGRGRIVNISSETGWESGGPFNGIYAMSKHAIEAYSDSLRRELMLVGIPVVKIQPGPFRTGMVHSIGERFEQAAGESSHFGVVLRKVGGLAAKEEGKAHSPETLAAVVEQALTTRHPRPAYSVHPARSRVLLEWLPTRLADRLLRLVLEH
jgi:NAD(P)-dependent dehydrogenase (short-subunit alcohol dehydrogenase family)